ncbi:hypothetical protein A9G11_08395 [Gilliamella sp. wkB108]|uniref:hypothetical protein n=1 Tax=Gilliamella sp. wkB108 TaxID=3120256 RepID=UPI00080EC4A2|nr:hypothetical protein [Gilliamella apicola]OCG21148.1 hypothetical protein A9G11_08395 [Gilliamella apicola]
MSWYTTGLVNLTNGSKTVTGVGTKWTNPLIGICAGQMLILKTTDTIEICEIASVQSDTQLTLANKYEGVTKTGVNYEIPTAPNVSVEHLALRISEMLNYYQQQMEGWQTVLTGQGEVTLTAPDGRIVTIKSQYSIQNELIKLVEKGKNFSEIAIQNAELSNNASQSAKDSESSAKTSADNAAKFADSASQSAKNAGNSATSAKTAETGAQTSATEAKQSALDAKNWVSTVDFSELVKKSGDTMSGNLTISNSDSSAVSLKNNKNEEWMLRIHLDGSFSIFNKNSDGKWTSRFRNESSSNAWRFENTSDVTIGGKSILKTGDYGIGAPTGTTAQNLDEHLNSGFYGTNTAKIPNLPFTGEGCASSLLVLPSDSPHWKVEQLSVINGRTPKIYYRTDTKNDGKQAWYEAITTANASADIVGALPAVKTSDNNAPIYKIGNQVDFSQTPTVNGQSVITDVSAIQNKLNEIGNRTYIVESYQNGDSWYKVYSNGFIEQSGTINIKTTAVNSVCGTFINLLKPMKTKNYGVSIDKFNSGPWAQTEYAQAESYTTAFWLASYSSIAGECWVRWTARGY